MAVVDDEARRAITELRRAVEDLGVPVRQAVALEGVVSRLKARVVEQERALSVLRVRTPPFGDDIWDPRSGQFEGDPTRSLADRMRAASGGSSGGSSLTGAGAYDPNLLPSADSIMPVTLTSSITTAWTVLGWDESFQGAVGDITEAWEIICPAGGSCRFDHPSVRSVGFSLGYVPLGWIGFEFPGAGSHQNIIRSAITVPSVIQPPSTFRWPKTFLAAAVQIERVNPNSNTGITSLTLRTEIWDDTAGVVVAFVTTDIKTMAQGAQKRVDVSYSFPNETQRQHSYRLRFRLDLVASAPLGDVVQVELRDPIMVHSEQPLVTLFNPAQVGAAPQAVGMTTGSSSEPDVVSARYGRQASTDADIEPRFAISASGSQRWGPGATTPPDTRLRRSAAKTLEVDDVADGRVNVWHHGDLVQVEDASLAVTYDSAGRVTALARSGDQGAASAAVVYDGQGHVTSVTTVRGGKTIVATPTYTNDAITTLVRDVV